MKNNLGSLCLKLHPGESVQIGEDITVTIPRVQSKYGHVAKVTKLRIQAPKNLHIDRLDEEGNALRNNEGDETC